MTQLYRTRIGGLAMFRLAMFTAMALTVAISPSRAQRADPEFDFSTALDSAAAMPRLHSVLVSWDGSRVLERYYNGRDSGDIANVKSVSKSVMSMLVGAAVDRGLLTGFDQTIGEFFPELGLDETRAAITIGDLLSMRSGLETTSNRNFGRWVQSDDWVSFALRQPVVDVPGGAMIYSTGNTHLLSAILTKASGTDTLSFAREVFAPLGFRLAAWPVDPNGIYRGGNDMEMTPRQMVAFGELYLNGGRVNAEQVIPEAWIAATLRPVVESPREEGRYYGHGWWVRNMAGFETPYAWGYGGQFVVLVPELDLVIVTTSSSNPGDDRRRHTRRIYDFVEYELVAPAARAIATAGAAGS